MSILPIASNLPVSSLRKTEAGTVQAPYEFVIRVEEELRFDISSCSFALVNSVLT